MTNEQSIILLRKEAEKIKEEYLSSLRVIATNNSKTLKDLLKCQELGNKYFNKFEIFVGESAILGAHKNSKWIIGFAEDCVTILNNYIEHINFLKSYEKYFDDYKVEQSKCSMANLQRIVKEYLDKNTIESLKLKFIQNGLSICGFETNYNFNYIKNKWRNLTMFEKIGVIGSFASIVGLAIYFIPTNSNSNNLNIKQNKQSPIIQNNYGDVIYNNNSNNSIKNINITKKINLQLNEITKNIKGKNKNEQVNINSKISILNEAKKINQKAMSLELKNKECKNKVNLLNNLMKTNNKEYLYKVCDDLF